MQVSISSARAVGFSLLVGATVGVVSGLLFALLFDKELLYGIGTMLFFTGTIVLVVALLAALEPPEGWATARRTRPREDEGRRSLAAKVTEEHPKIESASGLALAAWGVLVGGPLLGLSILAFSLAA